MFIPLGTDRSLRRPTLVNHVLVLLNLAVFIGGAVLERTQPDLYQQWREPLVLDPHHFHWWGLLSSAFLHANFMHVAGNMVFLWVFGPNIEDRFGRVGYLLFYLVGAAISGGVQITFYKNNPVIGASGAIAAVTGAYLVLFPHTRIKTLVLFFFIGVYEIPAWWLLGGQIAWNLFAEASRTNQPVATLAHLAGYGWGIAVAMLLLATRILKREPYDLFTMAKQAARRRQFKEVTYQRQRALERGDHPDAPGRARSADLAAMEAIARARADVTVHMPADLPAAAAAYRKLLETHGAAPGAALLSRKSQYDLANHLFAAGDHPTAATAYQLFLEGYPTDPELPVVRLMLGLISARYLNDPVRAKNEIGRALPDLPEGQRALARELLEELG